MPDRSILKEGDNCWRVAAAGRFAWLIDGEAYFRALRSCMAAARREILIVGWDIDSSVELIRDEDDPHFPSPLAETLKQRVERNEELCVRVLSWDFAMVYMLERELFPAFRFGWQEHERLHFHLDDCHATGASHHQKIVCIDGQAAFIGGLDLTKNRWDTPEHAPDDPRRVNRDGDSYRPFHDIQALVTGPVAADLRELAARRWEAATGNALPELAEISPDDAARCWPPDLKAQARDVRAGLARTWAPPDRSRAIREVEKLYLDMITAAKRHIYIENQYFTSDSVTDALCRRLGDADGPEIVIVVPGETSGWLEQATMETLRNQCMSRLIQADENNRLRVVVPVAERLPESGINVHSKLMIVDRRWLRIGSANISGRSMGLDSECDLVVEDDEEKLALRLLSELLAEHLGTDAKEIEAGVEERGLLQTLDKHGKGPRRLEPLRIEVGELDRSMEPIARIVDLEKPIEHAWAGSADGQGIRGDDEKRVRGLAPVIARWSAIVFVTAAVGWVLWKMRRGGAGFDTGAIALALNDLASIPFAPFFAIPAFVAGSLVVAPVTGMIAVCALLFDPWVASAVAIAGVLTAAAVNYALARRFGDAVLARVPDKVTKRVRKLAQSSDTWSVAGLRMIPIAPFTVFNLVAGACGVGLRDYMLGTLVGMGPGTVLICFTVDRARAVLNDEPLLDPSTVTVMALSGIMLIALRLLYKKHVRPK